MYLCLEKCLIKTIDLDKVGQEQDRGKYSVLFIWSQIR